MTTRVVVAIGFAAISAGFTLFASQVQTQREVCTFPNTLRYSPGAVADFEGQKYQCVWHFGDDLQPQALGWVKLSPENLRPLIR